MPKFTITKQGKTYSVEAPSEQIAAKGVEKMLAGTPAPVGEDMLSGLRTDVERAAPILSTVVEEIGILPRRSTEQRLKEYERGGILERGVRRVGEDVPEALDEATGGALESFKTGATRPLAGGLQQALPEDTETQDRLAGYVRKSEQDVEKRGFMSGTVPAFLGEMGSYYLGGRALKALGLPVGVAASTKREAVLRGGLEGAGAATAASELAPVTGETPEERQEQREERRSLLTPFLGFAAGAAAPFGEALVRNLYGVAAAKGWVGLTKASREARQRQALENKLTTEFTDFLNSTVYDGQPAKTPAELSQDIKQNMERLDQYFEGKTAKVDAPILTSKENPELLIFFSELYGPNNAFKKLGATVEAQTEDAFRELVDQAKENVANPEAIERGARLFLGSQTQEGTEAISKALSSASGKPVDVGTAALPFGKEVPTPENLSRRAANVVASRYQDKLTPINEGFNKVRQAMVGKQIPATFVANQINKFLSTYKDAEVRRRVQQSLPKSLQDVASGKSKEPVSYEALNLYLNDAQDAVEMAVDNAGKPLKGSQFPIAVRDFIDDTLIDGMVENVGGKALGRIRATAQQQYKALKDEVRIPLVKDESGNVTASFASGPLKNIYSLGKDKAFVPDDFLTSVLSSKTTVDNALENVPEIRQTTNDYLLSQLANLSDESGNISVKSLDKFLKSGSNKDILSSEYLTGAKATIDSLRAKAKESGDISIAEAFSDLLSSKDFIRGLKGSKRTQLLSLAEEAGAMPNLRQGVRDYMKEKVLREVESGSTLNKAFLEKIAREDINDPDIRLFKEVLGGEEYQVLKEGANRLSEITKGVTALQSPVKAAPDIAGETARGALEYLGIVTRLFDPAEATRAGAVIRRLTKEELSNFATELVTNPRKMTQFLDTMDTKDPQKLKELLASIRLPTLGASVGVTAPSQREVQNIPFPEKIQGGDLDSVFDAYGITETPTEAAPIRQPQGSLDDVEEFYGIEPSQPAAEEAPEEQSFLERLNPISSAQASEGMATNDMVDRYLEAIVSSPEDVDFLQTIQAGEVPDNPLAVYSTGGNVFVYEKKGKNNDAEMAVNSGNYIPFPNTETANAFIERYTTPQAEVMPPSELSITPEGLDLIKSFESWSPTPYKDSAGVWTIGYGSTYDPQGNKVTANTPALTRAKGKEWLKAGLDTAEKAIKDLVEVELTPLQYSALTSLIFNIGRGKFANSNLLEKINTKAGDEAILKEWKEFRKGGGKVLPGLESRREAETDLWLTGELKPQYGKIIIAQGERSNLDA